MCACLRVWDGLVLKTSRSAGLALAQAPPDAQSEAAANGASLQDADSSAVSALAPWPMLSGENSASMLDALSLLRWLDGQPGWCQGGSNATALFHRALSRSRKCSRGDTSLSLQRGSAVGFMVGYGPECSRSSCELLLPSQCGFLCVLRSLQTPYVRASALLAAGPGPSLLLLRLLEADAGLRRQQGQPPDACLAGQATA